jgi:hypothetical protein
VTRRPTLALALSLLCVAPAWAEDPPQPAPEPVARIAGPAEVAPGDLVTLDSAGSVGDGFAWARVDRDSGYLPVNGDRQCVFATGTPGEYTFILFAARSSPIKVASARFKVTVKGPTVPTPKPADPTVPPGPGPTPATPDTFGLTAFTRATLAALPWTPETRRPGATTLAAIFASQAASSASYTSAQAYFTATDRDCLAALGPTAYPSWNQALLKPLGGQFRALNAAGKLLTVAELSEAFAEIAAGLREVAP